MSESPSSLIIHFIFLVAFFSLRLLRESYFFPFPLQFCHNFAPFDWISQPTDNILDYSNWLNTLHFCLRFKPLYPYTPGAVRNSSMNKRRKPKSLTCNTVSEPRSEITTLTSNIKAFSSPQVGNALWPQIAVRLHIGHHVANATNLWQLTIFFVSVFFTLCENFLPMFAGYSRSPAITKLSMLLVNFSLIGHPLIVALGNLWHYAAITSPARPEVLGRFY